MIDGTKVISAALRRMPQLGAIVIPGVFAAGAVFGAAAALVMTPHAREALRRDVRELLGELRAAREAAIEARSGGAARTHDRA